jgi:hypothetical protein
MRDCFFIVADANMEYTLRGMLSRERFDLTLQCGSFAFDARLDLLVAVGDNDPGLFQRIESYVRPVRASHAHLVVMIDAEWAGSPGAAKIRTHIVEGCLRSGWSEDDVVAVVMDPELENWMWQDSPVIESVVGYSGPSLRQHLAASGAWPLASAKPPRPKETLEAELRRNRIPRSSALYRKVAEKVSVKSCVDPAFADLRAALQRWFTDGGQAATPAGRAGPRG